MLYYNIYLTGKTINEIMSCEIHILNIIVADFKTNYFIYYGIRGENNLDNHIKIIFFILRH